MDFYYPERISDDDLDDDISSCHSREIEGGNAAVDKFTVTGVDTDRRAHVASTKVEINDNMDITKVDRSGEPIASLSSFGAGSINRSEIYSYEMAAIIQQERNRRLGVRDDAEPTNINEIVSSTAPFQERVFGNIRDWFGSGGGKSDSRKNFIGDEVADMHPPYHATRRDHSPMHGNGQEEYLPSKLQNLNNTSNNDDSSSSNSSDESSSDDDSSASSYISHPNGDADLNPQERAREQALRYLSNSCVNSGRKTKTATYVWGLERLDLTRKRDRFAKELEVVESEMNKDHGLTNHTGERDPILHIAATLVQELPRIQGADTGACVELLKSSEFDSCFTTWDEFADTMNSDTYNNLSVWDNNEAVDVYMASLQCRLKKAVDRTRSLEKRLVVLENAGDDIISSLCEDLAEITDHCYKLEARHIKKGKQLQRKQRREELRHRVKIKQAERKNRKLEVHLMAVSGDRQIDEHILNNTDIYKGSDVSTEDSTTSGTAEDDEIVLEKNLSTLLSKYDQEMLNHKSEVEALRRQCEQLKLHLSVARLVMEGDDNLRDYMMLLERCDLSLRRGRKDGVGNPDKPEIGDFIPPPPSRISRARAKLLKVFHLERIYEQRLVVSKAFTDATIKALDQELVERETLSQEIEVRCLNELMSIAVAIKDGRKEATEKWTVLEKEMHGLQDAISACVAQYPSADLSLLFGDNNDDNEFMIIGDTDVIEAVNPPHRDPTQAAASGPPEMTTRDEPYILLQGLGDKHDAIMSNGRSQKLTHLVDRNDADLDMSSTDEATRIPRQNFTIEDFSIANQTFDVVDGTTPVDDTNDDETGASKKTAQQLGHELKCTLERYQTAYHSSTSRDRIVHLDTMNDLVVNIAKLCKTNACFDGSIDASELTSWSFKKSRKSDEDREQRRLKRKKKNEKRSQVNTIRRETMKKDESNPQIQLLPWLTRL